MGNLFENICQALLSKSRLKFPFLEDVRINLIIKPLKVGSMWASKRPFHYVLIIDSHKYKGATNRQINGAIAHELMHFETYERYGWAKYILDNFAFYFSKKLMTRFERDNDKKTICKGFGRDLFENRSFRLSKISKSERAKISSCYLTPNEIKKRL